MPVKDGEKGIRQSDAVFHHTVQLSELIKSAFSKLSANEKDIKAIGVSIKPSNQENSYMPCFLVGKNLADSISYIFNIPIYYFSHQDGHIVSALYSSDKLDLINEKFIAFHISGGTSQVLKVTPNEKYFETEIISDSLDLKAGQAIDRVGIMMGLNFPCGPELEKIALLSEKDLSKVKIYRKDGRFSLSGIENQCSKMFKNNELHCDIAMHCLNSIYSAIDDTIIEIKDKYGDLPLVFSGGVMSNSLIRNKLTNDYNSYFASPQFSSDNACGVAILSSVCEKRKK